MIESGEIRAEQPDAGVTPEDWLLAMPVAAIQQRVNELADKVTMDSHELQRWRQALRVRAEWDDHHEG